jgi:hypothetical protein
MSTDIKYKLNKAIFILAIFLLYNSLLCIVVFMSLYDSFPPFRYIEANGYHKDQYGNFQDLNSEDFICAYLPECANKLYKTIIKPRVTHVCLKSPDYINLGTISLKERPFFLIGCITICVNIFVSIVYILQLRFFIAWNSEIYPFLILFQYTIVSIIGYLYYTESNDMRIIMCIKRVVLMCVGFLTIVSFCYLVRKMQKLKNKYINDPKFEQL